MPLIFTNISLKLSKIYNLLRRFIEKDSSLRQELNNVMVHLSSDSAKMDIESMVKKLSCAPRRQRSRHR